MSEDYLARVPLASWNTARGVWETSQMNLLCGHLGLFSETWPTSGMMRNGQVFAPRMRVHLITGSGFSSSHSLPTPAASEPGFTVQPVDKDGNPTNNPNERWYDPNTGRLLQKGIGQVIREVLPVPEESLLRTPSAIEGEGGAISEDDARAKGRMVQVRDQMAQLAFENGLKELLS